MTTSFALPGTVAERKLQWKSHRESSFNSSHIHKTRLAEWDLNVPSTGALLTQSSTTIAEPSDAIEFAGHGLHG